MCKSTSGRTAFFENPITFAGAKLNPENRWIKMSNLIPWNLFEEKYQEQFQSKNTENLAKIVRMGMGSYLIKEKLRLSDEETIEHIQENPYLQWFIGMSEFNDKAPLDVSTIKWFRHRLTLEMIADVNAYLNEDKRRDGNEG